MTNYTVRDFAKPKVLGLAVHNARLAIAKAEADNEDRRLSFTIVPELCAYCLFGVRPDASVFPLAEAPTVSDLAPLVRKTNLSALVGKYKVIGFLVAKRKTGRKGPVVEIEPLDAPLPPAFSHLKREGGAK